MKTVFYLFLAISIFSCTKEDDKDTTPISEINSGTGTVDEKSYFPLEVGNSWEYLRGEEIRVESIVGKREINGKSYFIYAFNDAKDSSYYRIENDTLYSLDRQYPDDTIKRNIEDQSEFSLISLDAQVGDEWHVGESVWVLENGVLITLTTNVKTLSKPEKIHLDSTDYQDVLVLESTTLVKVEASLELKIKIEEELYEGVFNNAIQSGLDSLTATTFTSDYMNSDTGRQNLDDIIDRVNSEQEYIFVNYYAKGIGLVKNEPEDPEEFEKSLISYKIF